MDGHWGPNEAKNGKARRRTTAMPPIRLGLPSSKPRANTWIVTTAYYHPTTRDDYTVDPRDVRPPSGGARDRANGDVDSSLPRLDPPISSSVSCIGPQPPLSIPFLSRQKASHEMLRGGLRVSSPLLYRAVEAWQDMNRQCQTFAQYSCCQTGR